MMVLSCEQNCGIVLEQESRPNEARSGRFRRLIQPHPRLNYEIRELVRG